MRGGEAAVAGGAPLPPWSSGSAGSGAHQPGSSPRIMELTCNFTCLGWIQILGSQLTAPDRGKGSPNGAKLPCPKHTLSFFVFGYNELYESKQ